MRRSGDLLGLPVPGKQGVTLLILEYHQGLAVGGAVDEQSSHLEAPLVRCGSNVGEPVEIAALEEALPNIGHAPLHLGLVFGMPLKKDQVASNPATTSSSFWRCMGQTKQCLEWPSTMTMAHTVRRRPGSGSGIRPGRPKSTSATSAGGVSIHAHLDRAELASVPLQDETTLRRIRHGTATEGQQLMDPRHLQPVAGEPLIDLVAPTVPEGPARACRAAAATYLRTVSRERPVPDAICRLFPFGEPQGTPSLDLEREVLQWGCRCCSQSGLMTLKIWQEVPDDTGPDLAVPRERSRRRPAGGRQV